MLRIRPVWTAVFYLVLGAVVVAVLMQWLAYVFPASIADRVGHNSEGFVLALIVAAWIQFARPRVTSSRHPWVLTAVAAVACLAVGVVLNLGDLPSRFRTLNETFLAAGLILPYLQVRRPLPRVVPVALAVGVLAVVAVWMRTRIVTDLAEMFGALLLVPIGFDLVDRCILEPHVPRRAARYLWYVVLVAAPVLFSVLEYRVGVSGPAGDAIRYAVRVVEAFLFILLVEVYFTVAGRPEHAAAASRPIAPATV